MAKIFMAFLRIAIGAGAPCDIYSAGGTPCAAAHSVIRALFKDYNRSLYQLQRSWDHATQDIKPRGARGIADASAHKLFCSRGRQNAPRSPRLNDMLAPGAPVELSTFVADSDRYPPRAACVISIVYDQTGNGNHLLPASPAINNPAYDNPVNATRSFRVSCARFGSATR